MASAVAVVAAHKKVQAAQTAQKADISLTQAEKEEQKRLAHESWSWSRRVLLDIVHNHFFEAACGVIILFNMLLVILETDAGVDGGQSPDWVRLMTLVLLMVYTIELIVKLYTFRLEFFHDHWNVLDFFIVGLDLLLLGISAIVDNMPSVSVLRVFRLVRLARAFKAASFFRELHSLIRSFTCAMKAIFWGILMIVMTLTIWGILAVQLIHPVNLRVLSKKPYIYDGCDRCHRAFNSVFESMLTFFQQLVAGDSWGTVSNPVIEEAPWTSLFFLLVLVTVNLTMLNLILSVIVEAGATAAANDEHDKAMQLHVKVTKAEGRLIEICQGIDRDKSGSLNIDEFMTGFRENLEFRECLEIMNVTEDDIGMIFNICDEDDSGDVNYTEFVEQLRRIKNSGEQMLLHYMTDVRHMCNSIVRATKAAHLHANKPENTVSGEDVTAKEQSPTSGYTSEAAPSQSFSGTSLKDAGAQPSPPPVQSSTIDANQPLPNLLDLIRTGKLDRIVQVNESLVTVMADVASQSKAQTELLNALVEEVPAVRCSVNSLSQRLGQGTDDDGTLRDLAKLKGSSTSQVLPDNGRGLVMKPEGTNAPSKLCDSSRGWCMRGPQVQTNIIS